MTQRLRIIIENARGGNDKIASILNTKHIHNIDFDSLLPAKPPITPFPEAQPGKVFQKHFPTDRRDIPYYISPEAEAAEAAIAARARARAAAAEAKTEDSPRNTSPKSFLTRVREGFQRFTRKITRRTPN